MCIFANLIKNHFIKNKMKKHLLALILCLVGLFTAFAQNSDKPVTWKYTVTQTSATEATLKFTATIAKDWHLFAIKHGDGFEIPTTIEFDPSPSYKLKGKTQEPTPKSGIDESMGTPTTYYCFYNKVTFTQKITILDTTKAFTITGTINGQTCSTQCQLIEEHFKFTIQPFKGKVTQTEGKVMTEEEVEKKNDKPLNNAEKEVSQQKKATTYKVQVEEKAEEEQPLWLFFLASLLSGFIGLLMPCVFPMIPMTVSYFTKQGGKGKGLALIYGLSIVLIFVVIGIVFSAIFGPGMANELGTGWVLNIIFAIIFIIFAISMLGYFEITLPSKWVNKSAKSENKGGIIGVFFMALTLVLVSFSCTLPIAGAVALNAAGGSFFKPIIGMLGFSLGIAVPFTLFALFPGLLKKTPKSGSWMNTLKVILAFIELAFALKFINVPDQTYHWGILDREIYLAFWIVLFSLLGLYLLGKIRFPADQEMPVQRSWVRFTTAIFVFTFVVYMIPGMFGAPLNAISGWLPPVETHDFDLHKVVREEAKFAIIELENNEKMEEPHYADKLHLPHGLKGYFDYDQALRVAQKVHKPIFIDFTGHGCTNCRQVESKVWRDEEIRAKFSTDFIMLAMYVDDKNIELLPEDRITDDKGKEITLLGKKNMYISQKVYRENSQPCYFILDEDGSVLAGPTHYELDVEKYKQFLDKGIAAYKKKHGNASK